MPQKGDPGAFDDRGLVDQFRSVATWRRGNERAPHKPLLLLLTLGRLVHGAPRLIPWSEVEEKLGQLLENFGPARKRQSPHYPFWRLQNDGLWEIPQRDVILAALPPLRRQGDVPPSHLRVAGAQGGFSATLHEYLRARPALVSELVALLLVEHFPPSLHQDILDTVGIVAVPWSVSMTSPRRTRDPAFRRDVLRIYEHRCAVCGYDGKLGDKSLALEAAHIQWHAYEGPDIPGNGLAMCMLHHKALDRGAIGIDDERRILVSRDVHGGDIVQERLVRFAGERMYVPGSGNEAPQIEFIQWHRSQVFRSPARP